MNLKFHVSNTFLRLHAFGNVGGSCTHTMHSPTCVSVLLASHALLQATVGVGTVLIWYFCVAITKGGGGTRNPPNPNHVEYLKVRVHGRMGPAKSKCASNNRVNQCVARDVGHDPPQTKPPTRIKADHGITLAPFREVRDANFGEPELEAR